MQRATRERHTRDDHCTDATGPLRHAFAACHVPQARDVPGVRMALLALLPPGKLSGWPQAPSLAATRWRARMRHEMSASEHAYRARQRLATSAWWCGRPRANPANASVSWHRGKISAVEFERLLSLGSRPVRGGPGTRLGALLELSSARTPLATTSTTLPTSDPPLRETLSLFLELLNKWYNSREGRGRGPHSKVHRLSGVIPSFP